MTAKVIKLEEQYQSYLDEFEALLTEDPEPGTEDNDRLELLTLLLEDYEKKNYPIDPVDPIEAIKFRMFEKDLKQIDLAPYFGTKSRVSEVLSGRRALTVQMIRALSAGLAIPAETLIGPSELEKRSHQPVGVDWSKFPAKEMVARGWITKKSDSDVATQVKAFVERTLGTGRVSASFRGSLHGNSFSPSKQYSLYAWLARVCEKAEDKGRVAEFDPAVLSTQFLKDLARLSWSDYGPLLAIEYLERHGISVVLSPALKGTLLDGAALQDRSNRPVIGMTLRHDRLDNFWYTLLHETVHIWKHCGDRSTFVDDMDRPATGKIEAEANRIARDSFIPRTVWKRSEAYLNPTPSSIEELSNSLQIHPAVIAGRIRRETGNYLQFSDLVGQNEVRRHFPEFSKRK